MSSNDRPRVWTHLPLKGLSRRQFISFTIASAGLSLVSSSEENVGKSPWPRYFLARPQDELFIQLTARGFKETHFFGYRWLEPVSGFPDPSLVFLFPPQHLAESAIQPIPTILTDSQLAQISVLPSNPSQLVFRVPRSRLSLTLADLLAWDRFELLLPSLDDSAPSYVLEVPQDADHPVSRVEMPWGVELTPAIKSASRAGSSGAPQSVYRWKHSLSPQGRSGWNVLWTTALERADGAQNAMEVLSVRGFEQTTITGSAEKGNLLIGVTDRKGTIFPSESPLTPSLRNIDRIDIATSLSRRFPYGGKPNGNSPIDTGLIQYDSQVFNSNKTCVSVCYADGRTSTVDQFRLSARGGWLQLDGKWVALPGCGLTGWSHSASFGRDTHVELLSAGFLYPFGIRCELQLLTERMFIRDSDGRFIAVLIKQAFIQIPQPNSLEIPHPETPFKSISVTTLRTPPLDKPADGPVDRYRDYDFFLPMVDGAPFPFEYLGTDWADQTQRAAMPLYFVNNKARSANGLIHELNSNWNRSQAAAVCGVDAAGKSDALHTIPPDGDGLRVVDKLWYQQSLRFAQHGGALIALATPTHTGDTSQHVTWVEWARGPVPAIGPSGVADTPFVPRARTMKIQLQGMSQFSGQNVQSLATYRDTRFTKSPLLDPEPTAAASLYALNLSVSSTSPDAAYLHMLETRALVSEPNRVSSRTDAQVRQQIRAIYYGTTGAGAIPDTLFDGIDNESRFGQGTSAAGLGGLSVPDTHACTLDRTHGTVGDASFNERRWEGYASKNTPKPSLEMRQRLDYAAFRLKYRTELDTNPFELLPTPADLDALAQKATSLMGFGAGGAITTLAAPLGQAVAQLNLGQLFGLDAQLLPGISLAKIFEDVAVSSAGDSTSPTPAAHPMAWNVRVTGIDWLLALIGTGPEQISIKDILAFAQSEGPDPAVSKSVPFGIEATLNWTNDVFTDKTIGPAKFARNANTHFEVNALARVDLGTAGLPADLSALKIDPGKAQISARAEMRSFDITLFGAVQVVFKRVTFSLTPDGKKDLTVEIGNIKFIGPLAFIGQLSDLLSGLGNALGIQIDLTPQRVTISQTLRFPATDGQPLFIGPAQIIHLALGWSLMIPLLGRDVLSIGLAVSSREQPLTIYVPPWYGGKAYALVELTTRGIRLMEISMEYGALVPITWGIATGSASLTAGIFYAATQDGDDNGTVTFQAFVKAAADLTVAGIIQFNGLVYIALGYYAAGGRQLIQGIASVSVSIKIGFVRISYSFTAVHEQESGHSDHATYQPSLHLFSEAYAADVPAPNNPGCASPALPPGPVADVAIFSKMTDPQRAAFERILAGYVH